ncbi:MAG: ABC transporter ATP-binding protein [Alphaproteobacteria bacterium]|nr:ABC transporter ATP-binding protein [Alphaproteobacteria bacterium]
MNVGVNTTEPVLSLRGLSHRFVRNDGSEVRALDDVSLDVLPGEFICILGRSGHGKTTLLNAIAGLQPVERGEVHALGRPVRGPGTDRGVIFQRDSVFPWMRVEENVAFGLRVRGLKRRERLGLAREQLARVGLSAVARAWPRELSGGMRARVAIAAVFATDPPILLADEPFGTLDYVTKRQLQAVLRELWHRSGKTVLFVTHDVEEALMLGTRVIVVGNGAIAEDRAVDLPMPRTDDDLASPQGLALRHLLLRHMGLE